MAREDTNGRFSIDPAHQGLDIYADTNILTMDIWRSKYRYGDEHHPFDSMRRVVEGVYASPLHQLDHRFHLSLLPSPKPGEGQRLPKPLPKQILELAPLYLVLLP